MGHGHGLRRRRGVFGLNNFLATGELRADEFSSKQSMGAGPGSGDYDGIESWNDEGILTDQATQRQVRPSC